MKRRNVKIEHDGRTIYNETLEGANKAHKARYIRDLMTKAAELLPLGTACTLHYQQDGAKGWARYHHIAGSDTAQMI